jgi:hypothetical protein
MDAAKKLAILVDHMCSKPISLMARWNMQDEEIWAHAFNNVNTSVNQIEDNIEDYDLKNFVIPDIQSVSHA